MKRRQFLHITALSVAGTCFVPHPLFADETSSEEEPLPTASQPAQRPDITFVTENQDVTTVGFSDARSCTCVLREELILH
ncbi:MAG: hypothetical protein IIY06_10455 [Proteobacteria bacterium]|nr:hypothetical protein [Pseudomonadota bacterium]